MIDLVDTHCHLNFERYDEDRAEVVRRAADAGVRRIIIPAVERETFDAVVGLAQGFPHVYAAVGIHPNSTMDFSDEDITRIKEYAQGQKIVAIGEIGLDYHWDKSPKDVQKRALEAQLDLAAQLELPVIIHNRESSEDLMDILEAWVNGGLPEGLRERPGVLHSFSAPQETAERALKAGFYLGFTGPITFKKAGDLREIAAMVPDDRLLVETDGPFLSPVPFRGKRNEPAYIPHIVERLAVVRHTTAEEIARLTTANAEHLFRI